MSGEVSEGAVSAAVSTPEERLAAAKAERERIRRASDMRDKGFTNEDDYNAWSVLESLRRETLRLREDSARFAIAA